MEKLMRVLFFVCRDSEVQPRALLMYALQSLYVACDRRAQKGGHEASFYYSLHSNISCPDINIELLHTCCPGFGAAGRVSLWVCYMHSGAG